MNKKQPLPKKGKEIVAYSFLHDLNKALECSEAGEKEVNKLNSLILDRVDFGLQKYGTLLEADNGRDAFEDAKQELGDLALYSKQLIMEGKDEEFLELLDMAETLIFVMRFSHGKKI